MSEAKRYLYETFMPSYWEKNCTPKPLAPEPADMPLENKTQLVLILCVEHYRKIAKGQTFIWNEIEHQICPKENLNLKANQAAVKNRIDGSASIFVMDQEAEMKPVKASVIANKKVQPRPQGDIYSARQKK